MFNYKNINDDMTGSIILYDGSCVFCSKTIRWVLRHDDGYFCIAPQGSRFFNECAEKRIIMPVSRKADETVYLFADEKVYARTDALIRILQKCGRQGRVYAFLLKCIPRLLRDAMYRYVAVLRGWLSPSNRCPAPTPEQVERMMSCQ